MFGAGGRHRRPKNPAPRQDDDTAAPNKLDHPVASYKTSRRDWTAGAGIDRSEQRTVRRSFKVRRDVPPWVANRCPPSSEGDAHQQ